MRVAELVVEDVIDIVGDVLGYKSTSQMNRSGAVFG